MSEFSFNCPRCQNLLTVAPPTSVGDEIECPACTRTITVPKKPVNVKPIVLTLVMMLLVGFAVSRYIPAKTPASDVPPEGKATAEPVAEPTTATETPTEPEATVTEDAAPPEDSDPFDALQPGMTKLEIMQTVGRPDSTYGAGNKTYLIYGNIEVVLDGDSMREVIRRVQR